MKKALAIILAIVIILAAGGFIAFKIISSNLASLKEMPVADIDLTKVPDGSFTGTYKMFPIDVEVLVTVKDHEITDIKLVRHVNGQGGGAEVLPAKVVEAQSLQVDTISGATSSSKVILKAIENALLKAK